MKVSKRQLIKQLLEQNGLFVSGKDLKYYIAEFNDTKYNLPLSQTTEEIVKNQDKDFIEFVKNKVTEKPIDYSTTEISRHAYKRAKERLGWKRSTLDRMVKKVLLEGKRTFELPTNMINFMRSFRSDSDHARVHGENVFIFKENTLVTVYRLPKSLL